MKLVPETSSLTRLIILAFGILGAAALVLVRFFPERILQVAHCALRDSTGIPCPTCGGTQAAVALAQGRIGDAFGANPLVATIALAMVPVVLHAVLALVIPTWRRTLQLGHNEKRAAGILAALAVLGTWLYLATKA